MIHRPLKDARRQVLGIMLIPGAIIHIIEDAVGVAFVQLTERVAVAL